MYKDIINPSLKNGYEEYETQSTKISSARFYGLVQGTVSWLQMITKMITKITISNDILHIPCLIWHNNS